MQSDKKRDLLPIIGAAGVGAALMYFLDPDRGKRRRHLATDQVVRASHVMRGGVETASRDLGNRLRGLGAEARSRFSGDDVDDVVIAERIRAELGRAVSHPGAITVEVSGGRATVAGQVMSDEAEDLLACVKRVRGVERVEDQLERHDARGNVPALQGVGRRPASRPEILQEEWTPALRLATIVCGALAAGYALARGDEERPVATALGLAGLTLLARGASNVPFSRMVGAGAGRRAVNVQKTISIDAPVDEVYAWLTEWERWPEWMSHVREVRASGPRGAEGERTHWVVDGPAGSRVSWNAITTKLVPREVVAWKTEEGSPVAHAGIIRFQRNEDGSTRVDVQMSYNPVAGAAGHVVAKLFSRDPKHQLDDDLVRLKSAIETGNPAHDAAARSHWSDGSAPMSDSDRPGRDAR